MVYGYTVSLFLPYVLLLNAFLMYIRMQMYSTCVTYLLTGVPYGRHHCMIIAVFAETTE